MFKREKIVMLATAKSNILVVDHRTSSGRPLSLWLRNRPFIKQDNSGTPQHLYIVSDDKIQEGDWYIDDTEEIRQSITSDKDYWKVRQDYKKIIATTDKLPTESYQGHFEGKDCTDYLPQPSQSFIEKYVKQYNKGDQIIDVLVEYEEIETCPNGIWKDAGTMELALIDDKNLKYPHREKLKVNPKDNTITIKK